MDLITRGKVKDVYDVGGDQLRFHFSDRVSAYDVKFADSIPRKGEILCAFASFWFQTLDVPNHFVKKESSTDMIVNKMKMFPIECIARGYLYGSLFDRHARGKTRLRVDDARLAAKLPEPVFDPTTKSAHDVPVDRDAAVREGLVSGAVYDKLEFMTVDIYKKMLARVESAGFILADLKLEFGMLDGKILLGDSIGPDEFRLWPTDSYAPGRTQVAYDKQILRDWLTSSGHKESFEHSRAANQDPVPPTIPSEIVGQMTCRYIDAYERITGKPIS